MTIDPILQEHDLLEKAFDASDPAVVNTARKKARRKKDDEKRVTDALMQHREGRAFMYHLCRPAIEGDPLAAGDPYSTYYNLGLEKYARAFFRDLVQTNPDGFVKMMRESKERNQD